MGSRCAALRRWSAIGLLLVLLLLAEAASVSARTEDGPSPAGGWYQLTEDGALRVQLYVFWSTDCPHCRRAVRFIRDQLVGELPWLDARLLELSDPANVVRYQTMAAALGAGAAYVPAFFYCGRMFQGYGEDATTGRFLHDSLIACRAELETAASSSQRLAPPRSPEASRSAPPIRLPLLGELDPEALSLPVITLALAALDAFNPCAFFVLLFLLSLMVHARSRARMALVGGVFVGASGLLYFVFMAAWLNLFLLLGYLPAVTSGAGLIALLVGALNVKDYVWLRRGLSLSIPERAKPRLFERMRALVSAASLPAMLLGTIALALAANAYELLCTAGFPLVFTRILTLHQLGTAAYYGYLALYNLIYVLPLLAIVVIFVRTLGARRLKEAEGRALKLLSGVMMLGLGAVFLLAPDWLSQPLTALALIAGAVLITVLVVWLGRTPTDARKAAS